MAFIGEEYRKIRAHIDSIDFARFLYERDLKVGTGMNSSPILSKDIYVYPQMRMKFSDIKGLNELLEMLVPRGLLETTKMDFRIDNNNLVCGWVRFDEDVPYVDGKSYTKLLVYPFLQRETTYVSLFPNIETAKFFLNSEHTLNRVVEMNGFRSLR